MHSFQLIYLIYGTTCIIGLYMMLKHYIYYHFFQIKLLAPVALFVVFNGMLMPVAVWINSMDNDIGQVIDSNRTTLSVFIFLIFDYS